LISRPEVYLAQTPVYNRLRICVVGGQKTGKSTLAKALADHYRLVHIDMNALIAILDSPAVSSLGTLGERVRYFLHTMLTLGA
jgi:hypothetical protein